MGIVITTLVENTAGKSSILGEWGQSLLIEAYGMAILMDTGAGKAISPNLEKLGIDVKKVDRIVLSHGHYDHTGGLIAVLQKINRPIEIVAHPDIFDDKYNHLSEAVNFPIGIPFCRGDLEELGASFILFREPFYLRENILTTGEVPMLNSYEHIDPHLYVKRGDKFMPDQVLDDLSLIIKTDAGLVVLLGCAHRGVINILNQAMQLTGIDKIYAVIGGTHLANASQAQIAATISALKEMKVQKLAASHCTGLKTCAVLAQHFGDKFLFNNAGTKIVL